jgi:hypothetical protein
MTLIRTTDASGSTAAKQADERREKCIVLPTHCPPV